MINDKIIGRINWHAIDLKSIEKVIVVTDVHCSWFLRLHSNSKQYPLLHPLKGLLWLRNENVLSYNFMMWMKCCNISNVANLKFYLFWVRCFLSYPFSYALFKFETKNYRKCLCQLIFHPLIIYLHILL